MSGNVFAFLAAVAAIGLVFPAIARPGGGGTELVVFDCQPNHSLYVKALVLFDITPVLNEHTIEVQKISDQETRECQITSTEKAIVHIGKSAIPRNDNVSVSVSGWTKTSTFNNPNNTYTYTVDNTANTPDITYIETGENKKISHSNPIQCEADENHTVEQMATWNKPWSDKVPAGFTIDHTIIPYVVIGGGPNHLESAMAYNLPSTELSAAKRARALLKISYRDVALCRALGPDGRKWLAQRMKDGNLSYILEADTEPQDEYDAQAWKERHNKPVTVEQYREASEEIRQIALNITSLELRGELLDLSERYERLAGPRATGQ